MADRKGHRIYTLQINILLKKKKHFQLHKSVIITSRKLGFRVLFKILPLKLKLMIAEKNDSRFEIFIEKFTK